MHDISTPPAGIKPFAYAYIDSVELFFSRLSPSQRSAIERAHGRLEECTDRKGRLWGYRLIVNGPDKRSLSALDRTQRRYRGVISRFDIAIDAPAAVKSLIQSRALLRWGRGSMHDVGETTYWIWWGHKRRPPRNLLLYGDRPSKITGELDVAHLELRFLRAHAVRREGIHRVSDLLHINPKELFSKHVKWTTAAEEFVRKAQRRAVQEDRKKYRGQTVNDFSDYYRANISNRVRGTLQRLGYDRAQNLKNKYPDLPMKPVEEAFFIPEQLSFPPSPYRDQSSTTPTFLKLPCPFNGPPENNDSSLMMEEV
jgi:hypothetical protein